MKQAIQIIGIRRNESGKIIMVKAYGGDCITVEDVRKQMEKGDVFVAADKEGNVTRIGPRDETMIRSLPDDSITNNLDHLHEF